MDTRIQTPPAVRISATPLEDGSDRAWPTGPRINQVVTAKTTRQASTMRWVRATQGRTRAPRPLACHDETRRTTPTSRAVPGSDTTRKRLRRSIRVPYPRVVSTWATNTVVRRLTTPTRAAAMARGMAWRIPAPSAGRGSVPVGCPSPRAGSSAAAAGTMARRCP